MDPADFYSGIVVDAYAKLKSSHFDPQPYAAFIAKQGEPALELGCGDGEPMLDLRAAGLQVDGVDSSLDMVARCREEAARRRLVVEVHHQRVEDLALERRYASIYFAGPTFNLLADDGVALRGAEIDPHPSHRRRRCVDPVVDSRPDPAGGVGGHSKHG